MSKNRKTPTRPARKPLKAKPRIARPKAKPVELEADVAAQIAAEIDTAPPAPEPEPAPAPAPRPARVAACGLPFGHSPVDIGDPRIEEAPLWAAPRVSALRWALGIMLISQPVLLLGNTHALTNWANQQPVTPFSAPVLTAIQSWHDATARYGLDQPVARGAATWRALREARWPGQPPARPDQNG
ncbi:hypothetical protein GTZ99_02540 [Novosphingobium sp. FSY-8]|uniref:Uncharacterized protein n=1 Tax=Novosphingobium ovatum TaxID=1908523 RepID=A0ABW9XA73_9SPHN|nr:hypothetical protein [Novosphingobium ovatum]NBC35431.1 hypothetical protein [Novosphingobium ovatum]